MYSVKVEEQIVKPQITGWVYRDTPHTITLNFKDNTETRNDSD